MDIPEKENQILNFCQACGELRVKDVKQQLQKLVYSTSSLLKNVCGICHTTLTESSEGISVEKEVKPIRDKTGDLEVTRIEDTEDESTVNIQKEEDKDDSQNGGLTFAIGQDKNQHFGHTTKKQNTRLRKEHIKKVSHGVDMNSDGKDGEDPKNLSLTSPNDEDIQTHPRLTRRQNTRSSKERAKKVLDGLAINSDAKDESDSQEEEEDDFDDPSFEPHEESSDDEDACNDNPALSDSENSASAMQIERTHTYTKYGTNGVHPKLLEMMKPTTNPKRPFSCKLCDDQDFSRLSDFQKHRKTHTGEDPLAEPFYCTKCGVSFPGRDSYRKHEFLHTREKPVKCPHKGCKSAFTSKGPLNRHLRTHSSVKPFKCKYCKKGFRMKTELKTHERYHTGEKRFKCKECGKLFFTKRGLQDHLTIHSDEKPFQCDQCPYRCRLEKMLVSHQKIHSRKRYPCERCLHVFSHKFRLITHRKLNKCTPPKPPKPAVHQSPKASEVDIDISHITKCLDTKIVDQMAPPTSKDKPFKCKNCKNKEFRNIGSFVKHVTSHMVAFSEPKPYICPECGVRCISWRYLESHKVVHVVVRSFKCPQPDCNATFKTKWHSTIHNKSVHEKNKPYMCELCAASFPSRGKLKQHAYSHTDEKPVECKQCGKAFKYQGQLSKHMKRVHSDGAVFMCETCGKAFRHKEALQGHVKIHTGEKPHGCNFCDYRCIRKDNLNKHMKIHFKEKGSSNSGTPAIAHNVPMRSSTGKEDVDAVIPVYLQLM